MVLVYYYTFRSMSKFRRSKDSMRSSMDYNNNTSNHNNDNNAKNSSAERKVSRTKVRFWLNIFPQIYHTKYENIYLYKSQSSMNQMIMQFGYFCTLCVYIFSSLVHVSKQSIAYWLD